MRILYSFISIIFSIQFLFSVDTESSYPYLSGFTWVHFSDWKLLNPSYGRSYSESFDPEMVQLGDTIFVEIDCLENFAREYLPKIKNKFILISANYGYSADHSLPGSFESLLKEDKIAAWFVQNIDREASEKLIPIPIGLSSKCFSFGDTQLFDQWIPLSLANLKKKNFLYLNFTPRPERVACIDYFQSVFAKFEETKPFAAFLEDLSESIFVVSPPGHGPDCHRTWEALLMGCYPIVQSSPLNPLYRDLPVVIINDWSEVTEEFLETQYQQLREKTFSREKLYAPYWFQKVRKIQDQLKAGL